MSSTRRRFLQGTVATGMITIAGCPADSDDGGQNAAGEPEREQMLDRTVEINEDDFDGWTFSLNRDATLEYEWTVRSGPEIEIFVMEDSEYSHLRSGERFHAKSSRGTAGSDAVNLSASKEWAFVVDNSDAGNVQPPSNFDDDIARVEVAAYLL